MQDTPKPRVVLPHQIAAAFASIALATVSTNACKEQRESTLKPRLRPASASSAKGVFPFLLGPVHTNWFPSEEAQAEDRRHGQ